MVFDVTLHKKNGSGLLGSVQRKKKLKDELTRTRYISNDLSIIKSIY